VGVIVVAVSLLLVYLSNSKTAFALAFICPFLATFTLTVRKMTRVSPAIILLFIPLCFILLSSVSNFNFGRLSYILYGDSSLTGRTVIWDFADSEIARSPLVGWGYQSFWLVPNSPAVVDAPGWVKLMPNAHNGYIDTKLEMGYVGLAFLVAFILATLHAVGRVADRDPTRARLVLSLALFIILYNFFESLWMRGFEFLWVVFVIVAAEIGRYWRPFRLERAAHRSGSQRPGRPGPLPGARMPGLHTGLS
jgi:exopolysaccharide production protein ExoQ